eukprot:SM000314S12185  [mRNA]  locus=s314:36578:38753:- [translate_table: standard]
MDASRLRAGGSHAYAASGTGRQAASSAAASPKPLGMYSESLEGLRIGGLGSGRNISGRVDIGARARAVQAKRLWALAFGGSAVSLFFILMINTFQESLMFYITPTQASLLPLDTLALQSHEGFRHVTPVSAECSLQQQSATTDMIVKLCTTRPQALEKYAADPGKNRFRLGGLVLEGSIHHFPRSTEMEFVVTDLANEILVRYRGALPDLFREGHSVVAEGFLKVVDPATESPGLLRVAHADAAKPSEKALAAGCYFAATEVLAKHDEKYMPKEVAAAVAKNKAAIEASKLAAEAACIPASTTGPFSIVQSPSSSPSIGPPEQKTVGRVAQAPSRSQVYDMRT